MEIKELQALCEEVFTLKDASDVLKAQRTEIEKKVIVLKAEIEKHLTMHDLKTFDSGFGKVTRKERRSVSIDDRNLFLNWLDEKGMLRDSFNVLATRATTIYNEFYDEAKEKQDFDFITNGIPGLSEPKVFNDISIRGVKKK